MADGKGAEMSFRPQRQARKERLLKEGFLPFEAHALSRNKLSQPAMLELRAERKQWLKAHVKQDRAEIRRQLRRGETKLHGRETIGSRIEKDWRNKMMSMYQSSNWVDNYGILNPFARLREISDAFKLRRPDYRTPVKKTRVSHKTTTADYEKAKTFTVMVTYEVKARTQQEAERMAKRKTKKAKSIKVSDFD